MNEALTPKRAMILWCLLGRRGAALQGTIVPAVGKADREALVAGHDLTVETRARALLRDRLVAGHLHE